MRYQPRRRAARLPQPQRQAQDVRSPALLTIEHQREQRRADAARAAELAEKFTGWTCWSTRDGRTRPATRSAGQSGPDDGTWSRTLIGDDWEDLESQLETQREHDAVLAS